VRFVEVSDMKIRKLFKMLPRLLMNKLLRYRLLSPYKLERDNIDESALEAKLPELNKAAEEYFLFHKDNFKEEMKKPFLVDPNVSNMLIKLGWIFSELEFLKNLIVVDFGCGMGWLSSYLNRLGFNTIGIDVSKTALDYAASQFDKHEYYNYHQNYHFLHYDGHTFPLSDCSAHYIISFDAFHHVPNQAKILKEMHRVLAPGGKLILSEPGTGHALSEMTKEEVRKYNVLERDTNILDFEEKALAAGFDEIYLTPFFCNAGWKFPRKDYHHFFDGYVNVEFISMIRNTMIINPLFICEKAGNFEKSLTHKAKIKADKKNFNLKPGQKFDINISVKNTGQLAFQTRQHKYGGFVTIACRLFKGRQTLLGELGSRLLLERDLLPGETIELDIARTAPAEPGEYTVKIEPVYEFFYWFSEKDNAPAEIRLSVKK
jgi:SAM-dependent methyltransferase